MDNNSFQNLLDSLTSAGQALVPTIKIILNLILQGLQILIDLVRQGMAHL